LFIVGCNTSPKVQSINLKIDPEGAIKALQLIDYLSQVSPHEIDDLKKLQSAQIDSLVEINRDDKKLLTLIDELISTDVYDKLARSMKSFEKGNELDGKDAYLEAFTRMPYRGTKLMAGVDENFISLINSYSDQFKKKSKELVKLFNSVEFSNRIIARTTEWLPDPIFQSSSGDVTIYLYFDGNRGHFQSGNSVYFDLIGERDFLTGEDSLNTGFVEDVVAHELHHYIYGNWLKENTNIGSVLAKLDVSQKLLLQWQYKILLEGTAHFCNWTARPEFAQEMFLDNKFTAKVFNVWDSVSLGIKNGEVSEEEFNKLRQELEWKQASDWLREYLWQNYSESEAEQLYNRYRGQRPVLHYLVGIKIFREIYKEYGKEAVLEVLSKPESFLNKYNELTNINNELPKITPELVKLWSEML
ncbi:MAG: hypothetical protein KAQ62_09605, partial [Cyclobacteriaceae bacterium]|nr:hypothetical protein [Cyclobacteriaceae bacterium]